MIVVVSDLCDLSYSGCDLEYITGKRTYRQTLLGFVYWLCIINEIRLKVGTITCF